MICFNHGQAVKILLVEDNPGDIRLIFEVFKECKLRNELLVVDDGDEALEFLHKKGKYLHAGRPDIILLDLNLPRKNGIEVLRDIKNDQDLSRIPVVVLTTSKAEEDITRTYDLHANCFITKPFDLEKFITIAKSIENFWFNVVKLPKMKEECTYV